MAFSRADISNERAEVKLLTSREPEAKANVKNDYENKVPGEDDWTAIFLASRSFSNCCLFVFWGRGFLSADNVGRGRFCPCVSIVFTDDTLLFTRVKRRRNDLQILGLVGCPKFLYSWLLTSEVNHHRES